MPIKGPDLQASLKKNGLPSIVWLSGDDALQRQEATDAIRHYAKKTGYTRESISITPQFNWQLLTDKLNHYDMFSDKELIELQHPSGKFDTKAQAAIKQYLEQSPDDKRLVVVSHKLTSSQKKSKIAQLIQKQGLFVTLWPPSRLALPKWIDDRLKQKNLRADRYATALLAQYSEGDLSTANQAIEKLDLLQAESPITVETMRCVISDHANFSVFDYVDACLAGQPKRAIRILNGLRDTNQDATFILWGLTQQLKLLYQAQEKCDAGTNVSVALSGQWERRQPLLKAALSRLSLSALTDAIEQAFATDLAIKGVSQNNPWEILECLTIKLAQTEQKRP